MSDKAKDDFCYVARNSGEPGAFAACVDMPAHAKDTAKFVAQHIRKGHAVERVETEKARGMLLEWIAWRDSQKSGQPAPHQPRTDAHGR